MWLVEYFTSKKIHSFLWIAFYEHDRIITILSLNNILVRYFISSDGGDLAFKIHKAHLRQVNVIQHMMEPAITALIPTAVPPLDRSNVFYQQNMMTVFKVFENHITEKSFQVPETLQIWSNQI